MEGPHVSQPGASSWVQFKALLKRNVIIKKRDKKKTLTEFVMPLYFIFILAIIRLSVKIKEYPTILEEHDGSSLLNLSPSVTNSDFYVAPNSTEVRTIMTDIENETHSHVFYYESEEEIVSAYREGSNVTFAVIFADNFGMNKTYTIRSNPATNQLPLANKLWTDGALCRLPPGQGKGFEYGPMCPPNYYLSSGFIYLQYLIDSAIIKGSSGFYWPLNFTYLMSFPKNEFTSGGTDYLRSIVPLYMVFAWAQFIVYMMILIVQEKEAKIKESMKMMGLQDVVYWLSWCTVYGAYVVALAVICIVVLPLAKVFVNANLLLLFILFVLYGFSSIMLALLFTPFLNKAKLVLWPIWFRYL